MVTFVPFFVARDHRLGRMVCGSPRTRLLATFPLVTNNTREFERVPKLKIETWMTK